MKFNNTYLKTNIISVLIALIPLSFILGNPAININIVLIIIYGLFANRMSVFKIKYLFFDKLIFGFFLISVLSFLINSFESQKIEEYYFLKTFTFLRYLLLYCVLRFYFDMKKIDFSLFLISCSILVSFVCLDLFYQLLFGQDIFGHPIKHYKLSGPFGEELIAGSYLQRFAPFLFISIIIFFKKQFIRNGIVLASIIIVFGALLTSGNRMPTLLFLLMLFLASLRLVQFRKYFLVACTIVPLVAFSLAKSSEKVLHGITGLYSQLENISYIYLFNPEKFDPNEVPEQIFHFKSGIDTWSLNKLTGGGIKSFRFNCWTAQEKINGTWSCDTHPHNYYLEILSDLGLLGITVPLTIFILLILSFKDRNFFNRDDYFNIIFSTCLFLLFVEFFPIKSSGSFFSTFNAAYIFILLSIFVSFYKKNN